MIRKLLTALIAVAVTASAAMAFDGIRFNVAKGNKEKQFMHMIENELEDVGFVVSDPHERINDAYKEKYGSTTLDNLGFFSIANDEKIRTILLKEPSMGAFTPFNLHIYKKKSEDKTYVGHLTPEAMLDIVGVEDKALREEFAAMFPPLDKLVDKSIGGKVEYTKFKSAPKKSMMEFEFTIDREEDIMDIVDEFQANYEQAFQKNHYIIAGYKNMKEIYEEREEDFNKYDAYWVYSLCHFKFSYAIFDKDRPEAGVFAPCSVYMYIEKGSNKLIVGMHTLDNWATLLQFKDKVKLDKVSGLDAEIKKILVSLGGKER